MLTAELSAAIMLAPVLFYCLAYWAPPYHPARATMFTSVYLVVSLGPILLLVYRARAIRDSSSDPAAEGFAPSTRDPRIVVRAVRLALVAVSILAGLVLLAGFSHGLVLREDTSPVRGWPQTTATVTRVNSEWVGGSHTYIPIAVFRADGHAVYFTAPDSPDVVNVGDQIQVTYEPDNPYLLHDLSASKTIWTYPVYASLIALACVLIALVVGLTLTDQKRING